MAQGAGFELVGDFRLPDSAWWDDYYTPMLAHMSACGDSGSDGSCPSTGISTSTVSNGT